MNNDVGPSSFAERNRVEWKPQGDEIACQDPFVGRNCGVASPEYELVEVHEVLAVGGREKRSCV